MKKLVILIAVVVIVGAIFTIYNLSCSKIDKTSQPTKPAEEKPIPSIPIDSQKVTIPQAKAPLEPVAFTTPDGKKGWKVTIPGNRPLATPAIAKNLILIGGGFGSHEFYTLDAETGKLVWQYKTADDGPTAAVVEDNYVAFNTESCELEILTLDGKPVWKKWLGDPLMSMPAIKNGKVYMAYPGGGQHYLACFDLKTGKEYWKKPIAGEIITAPVIEDTNVYLATLEGTVYCFGKDDGELAWSEKKNATSSPCVWQKQTFFSLRQEVTIKEGALQTYKELLQQNESLAYMSGSGSEPKLFFPMPKAAQRADYLDYEKRKGLKSEDANESADSGVGFGGGGKGDSKMAQAKGNLGQATVSGIWSYQGSKPFIYKNMLYSAMGDNLKCVNPKNGEIIWQKLLKKENTPMAERTLTPPALVNNKIFLGTVHGDIVCTSATTGDKLWSINIGEPIVFQPAIVNGKVYVSTNSGSIYCIETGDSKDTGWFMWGANSAHNGVKE